MRKDVKKGVARKVTSMNFLKERIVGESDVDERLGRVKQDVKLLMKKEWLSNEVKFYITAIHE